MLEESAVIQENEDLIVKYLRGPTVDANIIGQTDEKFTQN